MNIICFCIESEHVGQPTPSLTSLNLVIADSELTSIVKGVVRMKVTGRWSDVISGWWFSVLLLGYFKGGCTFRLEEYVLVLSRKNLDLYSRSAIA